MKRKQSVQINLFGMVIFLIVFFLTGACAKQKDITHGMSAKEVIQRMGAPDSIAVQEGKLLRKLEAAEVKDFTGKRIVYIYEVNNIQIWFENGKVSGMTRNGVSVFL